MLAQPPKQGRVLVAPRARVLGALCSRGGSDFVERHLGGGCSARPLECILTKLGDKGRKDHELLLVVFLAAVPAAGYSCGMVVLDTCCLLGLLVTLVTLHIRKESASSAKVASRGWLGFHPLVSVVAVKR